MANSEHLQKLLEGVDSWNTWRSTNLWVEIDLKEADLTKTDLSKANLSKVNLHKANLSDTDLSGADLTETHMYGANLSGADLTDANLSSTNLTNANLCEAKLIRTNLADTCFADADLCDADFSGANIYNVGFAGCYLSDANFSGHNFSGEWTEFRSAILDHSDFSYAGLSGVNFSDARLPRSNFSGANLSKADLSGADLSDTDFSNANLVGADLSGANLSDANFSGANLTEGNFSGTSFLRTDLTNANIENAIVYGTSVWDIKSDGLKQKNLIISKQEESILTVDNIEVGQFIYLMLNNKKIRDVIGTIANKGVLILGRFTPERKIILDAIREKLRESDYLPIMFDFEKAEERDFTETIKILAGMAKFVVADITNPSSAPLELQATIPDYRIPFLPIIQSGEKPFAMFQNLQRYPWVMELVDYKNLDQLLNGFQEIIINRANEHINKIKEVPLQSINIEDYLKRNKV